jgi:hypothetical protein
LKQWVNNHTRSTSSGEGKQKLLDLSGKKGRRWQPYQAYSHLYYNKKLRQIIVDGYIEYLAGVPNEEPDSMFKYRNRELRVLLDKETDEVKAEVGALCERSVTVKEEAELKALMEENLSDEDARNLLRKRLVTKFRNSDYQNLQRQQENTGPTNEHNDNT